MIRWKEKYADETKDDVIENKIDDDSEGAAAAREEEDEQYEVRVSLFASLFFKDRDQLQSDGGELFMHHA
jgi:hypothetical protein